MRYADVVLFLIPAGLALAWVLGVRGLSRRGVLALLLLLAGLGGTLLLLGNERSFNGRYVPAHLQGNTVVSGHAS